MNILVTGAKGFIGRNLVSELKNRNYGTVFECDRNTSASEFEDYCSKSDFVFHLAGVNRPTKDSEFMEGNFGFTSYLLETLKKKSNNCPIMISSSAQANLNNPYGESKKAGEDLLISYSQETGADILIYRLPNVFGKWCKPNYNSVVATFCYNVSRDFPIEVNNPENLMTMSYIDDVVNELICRLDKSGDKNQKYYEIPTKYSITLGHIADLIKSFKNARVNKTVPNMSDDFTKKLYSTYLSYLPTDDFKYELKMNVDQRGSFTEFLKTPDRGQVSVNISRPGIIKGNHWHHTKNEKFLVVSGTGIIRFRKIGTNEIIEYSVSGETLEVVDIPVGYTHNIENIGVSDLVTIMWANEPFDSKNPDTYFVEV